MAGLSGFPHACFCESYAFIKQKRPFHNLKGTLSHRKSIAFALLPKLCLILSVLLHAFLVFYYITSLSIHSLA